MGGEEEVQGVGGSKLQPQAGSSGALNNFLQVSWKFVHCAVVWRKVKTGIWFRSDPEETDFYSVLGDSGGLQPGQPGWCFAALLTADINTWGA